MNVLFIGGTGIVSSACTRLALRRGINLTLLTRGKHVSDWVAGAETVHADINDPLAVAQALRGRNFDVVVNWIAFVPAEIERDRRVTRRHVRQVLEHP